jgi:hypothetical protein
MQPQEFEPRILLKARAVDGESIIADALNEVPDVSKQVRAIGWCLVVEQMPSVAFYEDTLAFTSADNYEQGRRMLLQFADLLDRNVEYISGLKECFLQAWVVGEVLDEPVRHLNLLWSRHRATNHRVVSLFAPNVRMSRRIRA